MYLLREAETRRTKFRSIAQKARENPEAVFTSLAHHLTEENLFTSFHKLRRSAATGIDKVNCQEYGKHLPERITDLHQRLKEQRYRATEIRRAWIDKGGGKQRPLGISTTEDKIVQRAVTDILNLIYEQDFYDFSYGYRPGRSAHQALTHLRSQCMSRKITLLLSGAPVRRKCIMQYKTYGNVAKTADIRNSKTSINN